MDNTYFLDEDFESFDSYDYDYKRDTLDALTDGMYGDYDEWKERGGDLESLIDSLRY